MLISSRGRYRLQVMIDLVKHTEQRYISLKEIAERQGFSLRHLGNILPALVKNKIIVGHPGKGGGYRLNRAPNEYTLGEILRLAEGSLAPVVCSGNPVPRQQRAVPCRFGQSWTGGSMSFLTVLHLKNY